MTKKLAVTLAMFAEAIAENESRDAHNLTVAESQIAAQALAQAQVDVDSLYRAEMRTAFDSRASYEHAKNAANESIQRTISDLAKSCDHDSIARIFRAAQIDSNFINKSERISARFNVYSAQKVVNIARAIAKVESLNHYSRAIFASAIALQNADMQISHHDAASACSLNVKTTANREKLLSKYAKHVEANTAATQSSSSINALKAFDILRETRDSANVVCYDVNRESAATIALASIMQIAL